MDSIGRTLLDIINFSFKNTKNGEIPIRESSYQATGCFFSIFKIIPYLGTFSMN